MVLPGFAEKMDDKYYKYNVQTGIQLDSERSKVDLNKVTDNLNVEYQDAFHESVKTKFSLPRTTGIYGRQKQDNMLKSNLKTFAKGIRKLHGASHHQILLFVGNGVDEDNTWRVHTEVVERCDVKKAIEKRKELGLLELPECRSPCISVMRIKQIRVSLSSSGSLMLCQNSPKDPIVINIVHHGDKFVSFPVKRNNKDKMATVYFKGKSTGEKLHTAHFDPRQMSRYQIYSRPAPPTPPAFTGKTALPGTFPGFWKDSNLMILAKQISLDEMLELSFHLGVTRESFYDFKHLFSDIEVNMRVFDDWMCGLSCSDDEKVSILCAAMKEANLNRIASIVKQTFERKRTLSSADFQH